MADREPYDLTSQEVADLLHVSISTVQRWSQLDYLPSWKTPSGRLRFRRSDVLALLPPDREPVAS